MLNELLGEIRKAILLSNDIAKIFPVTEKLDYVTGLLGYYFMILDEKNCLLLKGGVYRALSEHAVLVRDEEF